MTKHTDLSLITQMYYLIKRHESSIDNILDNSSCNLTWINMVTTSSDIGVKHAIAAAFHIQGPICLTLYIV